MFCYQNPAKSMKLVVLCWKAAIVDGSYELVTAYHVKTAIYRVLLILFSL
jgi:hypothetical protein